MPELSNHRLHRFGWARDNACRRVRYLFSPGRIRWIKGHEGVPGSGETRRRQRTVRAAGIVSNPSPNLCNLWLTSSSLLRICFVMLLNRGVEAEYRLSWWDHMADLMRGIPRQFPAFD
jgi:hypothetical protein